ncbi:sugar efflux transporter [Thalassotalea litorea]|uniref:sugar efflux transporter n=1 Tax=Thalassotalea litorea TaxID=2020715 RepID=UPI0037370569
MSTSDKHRISFRFYLLSALAGLAGSLIYPLMSLFLVDGLGAEPIMIGVYTVSVTLSGLLMSQWLGNKADRGSNPRKLFSIAMCSFMVAVIIYANTQNFVWVWLAGLSFMALGNSATPQMLTLARQWANDNRVDSTIFNARIRAAISFSWMTGPPLAFALASAFGYQVSFYAAAACALFAFVYLRFGVPATNGSEPLPQHDDVVHPDFRFWLLAIAMAGGMAANLMYSSSLPLYVARELEFATHWPGVFMGLVACLEIPVMLYSAKLARRISKEWVLVISFAFAITFYFGIFNATQVWQFLALQILNALFYGLFAGVGLTLMQEQIPTRVGFTSAVYSNALKIGMMIGASMTGLIAQFSSFQYASIGAMLAVLIALISLCGFRIINNRR